MSVLPATATIVEPVVRVRDLRVSFPQPRGAARALKGVSLDVAPGEIVAVVGESGSGKTVFGLSLLGLLRSTPPPVISGCIEVAGTVVTEARPGALRALRAVHLGAVFQDPMTSLNPTMSIGAQLLEVAASRDDAIALLRDVGVPEPASRFGAFPHELSGGQRQRVMLAMAIARRPDLIVLDEPTTALDVTVQAQVLDLLVDLRASTGSSMIFITHDLGVAAQVADRIAVMYAGRILELGSAKQVLSSPSHPYTMALLRSRLSLTVDRTAPIPQMRGEIPSVSAELPGCLYGPRCDYHLPACDATLPELAEQRPGGHVAACIRLPIRHATGGIDGDAAPLARLVERRPREGAELVVDGVEVAFRAARGFRKHEKLLALRGVSLEIARGECVGLVGESGCGKSTLLRVVAGLQKPTAGSVTIASDGYPQMVFQDAGASLTPWLTVEELVGERLRRNGIDRRARADRVRQALKLVGLPEGLLRAKPHQLSGGQRQRLAFARAIVVPPPLLLADEPTSALDVSLAAVVLNLIGSLRRELNMAVLFVTHDIAAARVVADRLAVMYLGHIVEEGSADAVTTSPRHPYTQALVAAVPSFDARHSTIRGEPASPVNPPTGCAYHPRCSRRLTGCDSERPPLISVVGEEDRRVACVLPEAIG